MSKTVVSVAVEQTAYHFDKSYDYFLPSDFDADSIVGKRVLIPFGRGTGKRCGFVVASNVEKSDKELKSVSEVLDDYPVLNSEMLCLGEWIKDQAFSTLYDVYKAMLPSGLNMQLKVIYRLAENLSQEKLKSLSFEEGRIAEALSLAKSGIEKDKLMIDFNCDDSLIKKLVNKGIIVRFDSTDRRTGDATVRTVRLLESVDETVRFTPKQREIISLLQEIGPATIKEICYFTGIGESVIKTLEKKGYVEIYDTEIYRTPVAADSRTCEKIRLNKSQSEVFNTLSNLMKKPNGAAALLYGVTGSGKTQVYLKLIEENINKGKDAIVMVPEISLTPQLVSAFKSRFRDNVAVFHSRLSMGERLDEWKRVKRGEAKIAIGTRSAIFAPFENLGLIVIDEEQEHTYKSESSPRYHARDVARFRAAYHNALLLLASATPSVESFAKAKEGKYVLCRMDKRYGNSILPEVKIIDMREEIMSGNTSIISSQLLEMLKENKKNGNQSILLLNRRGYNTYISCRSCGKVISCDNCSISMSYHRANNRLMCHYCGASKELPDSCPECGGEFIKMSGVGTQYAEDEIKKLIPEARILRMDADTTMAKNSHAEKLTEFAKGEYDILVGTQMVAKGLDFEKVTLVGVLNADQAIYNSDFRAYERAFSLLTQVIGRAGRSSSDGIAVLQTMTPDNEIIKLASNQNYDKFFAQEIALRRVLEYPPYCDICMLGFVGRDDNSALSASKAMFEIIKNLVCGEFSDVKVKILGPSPAKIIKVGGKFRYRIIIKCKNSKRFREMLKTALCETGKLNFRSVSVYADMNPEGIL